MAGKTAILSVRIISDATAAKTGFNEAEKATREFESSLNTASIAAGVALASIAAAGAAAISAASDLEQSGGAVAAVFGSHADEIGKLADDAARRVGLAQADYQQLSAVLGAQLKNLGIEESALVGQTDELITLGADLAAVFNGTTSEAVGALSALMRGERDPIERYGVTIKQSAINAKLAEMGLDGLEGQARTTAEAHAALALLTEQTAHANGQFASEMDTAAVSQQVATALWKDAAAELGTALLPLVVEVATWLSTLAETYAANADVLVPLTLALAGFVATVAGLVLVVKTYRMIAELAAAAQVLWNVAMTANPIGLLIAVIVLLIGFIILIAANWDEVRVIWGDAVGSMIGWIEDLINWVIDAINWIGQLFGATDGLSNVDWGLNRDSGARAYVLSEASPPAVAQSFALRAFAAPTGRQATPVGLLAAPSSAASTTVVENHFNISGALDPVAVGRQIQQLLDKHGKQAGGTLAAGGTSWQPRTNR